MKPEITRITAEQTHPLRHAVLRPHQEPDEMAYPGDDAPDTLHLGAWLEGVLIGIASVYREPPPNGADAGWWRLRGMAVQPDTQGRGIGGRLIHGCLVHVAGQGGTTLWCNARTGAAGFYRALGFSTIGDEFEIEGIGPHFIMTKQPDSA